MRELAISELSLISGGAASRVIIQGAAQLAKNPVAQGGVTGGVSYVGYNVASGNEMSMAGGTGAVVAGMFGGRFGGNSGAAIAASAAGGLAERSVNNVNNITPPYKLGSQTNDKSGNNYGH